MKRSAMVSLALVVVTLAVYLQVANHQFLEFDDNVYVTGNPHVAGGISARNLVWALTTFEASNWHPVTWVSHMMDAQLYGMHAAGHHLTNVFLHIAAALLLLLLLYRYTGMFWQSSFVSALFALHPTHVESVAWLAERKDVLSAVFWCVTLLLYREYALKRSAGRYLLCLGFFVLGLMTKPMLVTLPLVLLLLDYWPLDRYRAEAGQERGVLRKAATLLLEKIPFLALSLLSGLITVFAQHEGGAMSGLNRSAYLGLRIENALVSYVKYLGKTFWPSDLALLYPTVWSFPRWQPIGAALLLLAISVGAVWLGRRHRYLPVGWFWFLVTLVPVIGLLQVGEQAMADRYTYLPGIGISIMLAWGVPELLGRFGKRRVLLAGLAAVSLLASAFLTWQQTHYWRDTVSLFRRTLQVTADNYNMHNKLGFVLAGQGDLDGAIAEYREAIRINPDYAPVHNNLGLALFDKGGYDAALGEYRTAIRISPFYSQTYHSLGLALFSKGELDPSIRQFQTEIKLNPRSFEAHNSLGIALASKGDLAAAIKEFQTALRIYPEYAAAQANLRTALGR